MSLSAPRAILFDWDNTLVDTWVQIHHVTNHTLQAMGHPAWSFEQTKARVRASARDTFPQLFGERADQAMEIFTAAFQADHLSLLAELPGTGDALRALQASGKRLAVVSNKIGPILRREAAHLGWSELFHRLVGGADAARDKPAIEPVLMALEGSGLSPGPEIWLVGDTDTDMICAHNAGCLPVLLRPERPKEGEFAGAEPAMHVATCRDLVERALSP